MTKNYLSLIIILIITTIVVVVLAHFNLINLNVILLFLLTQIAVLQLILVF